MTSKNLFSLKGKVALVTGGARGLGFAMACALAEAGAKIAFNAKSRESIENGMQAYFAKGIEAKGYVCDVADETAVKGLFTSVNNDIGPVDILFNNAGIINRVAMIEMTAADFRRIVDVDLTGAFIAAKTAIPSMIQRGGGKIINVCGIMSEVGRETAAAYASAKGGLKMLTKNIAAEYGSYNIQCNGIGPGYMATALNEPLREKMPNGAMNPFDRFIRAQTPVGRWGDAKSDLAGPAVFLASAASDFVNGQILYVDGGFLSYLGRNV
ncbi:MAG: gluconate 5-dehydrogenase [Cloacibacillus sp.]